MLESKQFWQRKDGRMKKLILIGLIFAFVVVCNDTNWIEDIFKLNYCMGEAQRAYLLALIASILILKK